MKIKAGILWKIVAAAAAFSTVLGAIGIGLAWLKYGATVTHRIYEYHEILEDVRLSRKAGRWPYSRPRAHDHPSGSRTPVE